MGLVAASQLANRPAGLDPSRGPLYSFRNSDNEFVSGSSPGMKYDNHFIKNYVEGFTMYDLRVLSVFCSEHHY